MKPQVTVSFTNRLRLFYIARPLLYEHLYLRESWKSTKCWRRRNRFTRGSLPDHILRTKGCPRETRSLALWLAPPPLPELSKITTKKIMTWYYTTGCNTCIAMKACGPTAMRIPTSESLPPDHLQQPNIGTDSAPMFAVQSSNYWGGGLVMCCLQHITPNNGAPPKLALLKPRTVQNQGATSRPALTWTLYLFPLSLRVCFWRA